MARRKNKNQEDALQQLGLVPGAEQQPTPEGEQPADAQEAPDAGSAETALAAPELSPLARRYQVELTGLPDTAAVKAPVIAINETEAFAAFKKRHGIIRTNHRPTITDLGPAEMPE
jgi:hypothetical protein